MEKWPWRHTFLIWRHHHFFWYCFVSLVKFSYWSKFHVHIIITGSRVMTIFFYKGLTRNLEIRKTPVWILPNIWRLGRVRDTTFGTNVVNKMLVNAGKFQGYSFYRFWVIKGKPTWGIELPTPTQIRVKMNKSVYVASRTYQFCWQYAIILVWKIWSDVAR